MLDRTEISRALAKAITYKNCNKQDEADTWARELIRLLECAEILKGRDMKIEKYNKFWAVYDEQDGGEGVLVCVCVYKKGAVEVARRLSIK